MRKLFASGTAPIHAVFACAIVLSLTTPSSAPAAADNETLCNRSIGKSVAQLRKRHHMRISKCLRFANYVCPESWFAIDRSENQLRAHVAGEGSRCAAAVTADGVPVSSFGPASCPDAWNDCDAAVPTIATLDDLAECLVCVEIGYDRKMRADMDFPAAIDDIDTRRCVHGLYETMTRAIRVATHGVDVCADDSGARPFTCPADPSPETKYGVLLDKLERLADNCDDETGSIGAEIQTMCNGTMTNADDLAECFVGIARCLSCRGANSTYGQSEDCAAAAGAWDCSEN